MEKGLSPTFERQIHKMKEKSIDSKDKLTPHTSQARLSPQHFAKYYRQQRGIFLIIFSIITVRSNVNIHISTL